jgi:hypothetical protein
MQSVPERFLFCSLRVFDPLLNDGVYSVEALHLNTKWTGKTDNENT